MDARTAPGARDSGAVPGSSAAPSAPSVIGRLGPYRLLQVIGGGGMGVVHLGLDPAGRAVAIKVMRPHVAADPSARSRLAREVDALRRVRSPRVAEVLDADPDAEQPYVVTEFVPAPALDAFVEREGPLQGAALGRLGLGLGDALAAIHAAGVVHRDLKPGNVLVTDTDPVVIDFGIAQVADDVRLTSAGLVMGTPGYLSPETLDGASLTASGDWWGWAATLAFAATGRPPFGGGPTEAVLSRVRRGAADLDGAPEGLAALLASALSPDPARRPPPRKLRQAAQALLEGGDDAWPVARTASAPTVAVSAGSGRRQPETATAAHTPAPVRYPRTVHPGAAAAATSPFPGSRDDGTVQLPETAPPMAGTPPEAAPVPWPEPAPVLDPTRALPAEPDHGRSTQSRDDRVGRDEVRTQALGGHAASLPFAEPAPSAPTTHRPAPMVPAPMTRAPIAPVRTDQEHFGQAPVPQPGGQPPSPYASFERGGPAEPGKPLTRAVLLLMLVVVVALGAVAPLVALMAVAVGAVVARTVDRTVASAVRRRYERGPRAGDGARIAVAVPGNLVVAALTSVPALLLPAAMAVSTAFLVGWVIAPGQTPVPGYALPLASAVLAAQATAWWGPGGRSVRRGTRTAVRGALPGRTSSLVAVSLLALLLVACVLVVLNSGGQPDWTPLTSAPPGLG